MNKITKIKIREMLIYITKLLERFPLGEVIEGLILLALK